METNDPVEALRRSVADAGFTMKDVCQRAGVAESTPSRWSKWPPKVRTIQRLHEALAELIATAQPVDA